LTGCSKPTCPASASGSPGGLPIRSLPTVRCRRAWTWQAFCSFHYARRVANDNTVRLQERLVQLPRGPAGRSYAHCHVQLQERLDGSLVVLYQGHVLARQPACSQAPLRARPGSRGRELPASLTLKSPATKPRAKPTPGKKPHKPADDHPWRTLMLATTKKHGDKLTGQLT
ncbi:MAG TPA: hypothetical protein VJL07_04130, partial [Dehalococcoidia bacterium]|nr:hypothetical protein [Dehalococcoidia bacterium]